MSNKLEIACFNVESALIAQEAGADRIELCCDYLKGGTTPIGEHFMKMLRDQFEDKEGINMAYLNLKSNKLNIPVYAMIRPRGGNFIYFDDEFEDMKLSIKEFKKNKFNGFVFGILRPSHESYPNEFEVDRERCEELVELAYPLPCTFHRAFDVVDDMEQGLDDVIACGFSTILSSGKATNAVDGLNELQKLIYLAEGRITIMPGGGIRSDNIALLKNKLNTDWFHSSALPPYKYDSVADFAEVKRMKITLS